MRELIKGKRIICYFCIGFILFVCIGNWIWGRESISLPAELTEAEDGTEFSMVGEVYKLQEKDYGQLIYLESGDYKWLLYDYDVTEVYIGNRIQVSGELCLFDSARNPGNFDALNYYNGIGLVAAMSVEELEVIDDRVSPVLQYLYQLRKNGIERIYEVLDEEEGSLLVAMIFGEKDDMDDEQEELYQKIGISHIFAISGLHISLLSLVIYQLLRRTTGSFAIAGIVSGIFLGLYILMIGMGISAIRAGTMFGMRVGADISGRVYDIKTSLAIAALCILLPNSLYLYQSGFLLSFGAILGVIYIIPFWNRFLEQELKLHGLGDKVKVCKIAQGIGASLGIQAMLLPILLYFYYEVSPYSILVNLLVIPLMTILLGIGMLGVVLSIFWYAGGAVLIGLSGWFLQVIDLIGDVVISMPFSRIILGIPWWPMMILYYVIMSMCLGYVYILKKIQVEEGEGLKSYRRVGIILCLLPLLLVIHLPNGDMTVTMLDVGQGDGLYIEGPEGGSYFVDGGSTDISNVGKYRIETYLRSIGVASLDYVFISHGDADHLNGIEEMLARQELGIRIKTLVVCGEAFLDDTLLGLIETAQMYGTQVAIIQEGMQVLEGDMAITYLAPASSYEGEIGNASSMVLELEYGEFSMLFTGDVEGEGEEQLLTILKERAEEKGIAEGESLYDVLKVGHHGSSSSTSEEFMKLLLPDYAFISAGVDSIYGHPHEEVLERLEAYGCEIYTTSQEGGVVLSYKGNSDTITINSTLETCDSF